MKIKTHPSWPLHLVVAVVALAVAALAVPMLSSAKSHKADGVRADLKHGTLRVQGGDGGQQVALRLKTGDPSVIRGRCRR